MENKDKKPQKSKELSLMLVSVENAFIKQRRNKNGLNHANKSKTIINLYKIGQRRNYPIERKSS
jgi:hypothetical protein